MASRKRQDFRDSISRELAALGSGQDSHTTRLSWLGKHFEIYAARVAGFGAVGVPMESVLSGDLGTALEAGRDAVRHEIEAGPTPVQVISGWRVVEEAFSALQAMPDRERAQALQVEAAVWRDSLAKGKIGL